MQRYQYVVFKLMDAGSACEFAEDAQVLLCYFFKRTKTARALYRSGPDSMIKVS